MFKRRNVEISKDSQQASELESLLTSDWQVCIFLPQKISLIQEIGIFELLGFK